MPIYMIIPRYSHNYAQFCQLLNSNLFTHRRILMLLREATSETYGPRVSFSSYQSPSLYYCFSFTLLLLFTLHLYTKNTKNIIYHLYQISLLRVAVKGLTTPLSHWLQGSWLFVQVLGDLHVVFYWIDTLGLNRGKYLSLLCCITLSSSRENQRRAQEVTGGGAIPDIV